MKRERYFFLFVESIKRENLITNEGGKEKGGEERGDVMVVKPSKKSICIYRCIDICTVIRFIFWMLFGLPSSGIDVDHQHVVRMQPFPCSYYTYPMWVSLSPLRLITLLLLTHPCSYTWVRHEDPPFRHNHSNPNDFFPAYSSWALWYCTVTQVQIVLI